MKENSVTLNGLQFRYIDWGGSGEVLLFLAGMGCSAWIFDGIAPQFTDKFKILGFTRRGCGKSDYPDTGYDIDTLTDDIKAFLDYMEIKSVILAGHSMAGLEISEFYMKWPEIVTDIIFLDAATDRTGIAEVHSKRPVIPVPPAEDSMSSFAANVEYWKNVPFLKDIWNPVLENHHKQNCFFAENGSIIEKETPEISAQLGKALMPADPDYSVLQCPVLSFYAFPPMDSILPENAPAELVIKVGKFINKVLTPWKKKSVEKFRKAVPHAVIVEFPDTNHYCFIDKEQEIVDEMKKFLKRQSF